MTPNVAGSRRKKAATKKAPPKPRTSAKARASRSSEATPGKRPTTRRTPGSKSARPATTKRGKDAERSVMERHAPPVAPQGLEVDPEVLQFIEALDLYRRQHGRPFPSWSEVLHVVRWLGYRRD